MFIASQLPNPTIWQQEFARLYRAPESDVLAPLTKIAGVEPAVAKQVATTASSLIETIRQQQVGKGGVDALLHEFSLSTEEGIVLMCLAEALLRVPDDVTTDRLIRDKLLQGDWSSHLGNSESLFVNASAWGLLLTGKVVNLRSDEQRAGLLKRTVSRLGEPVIRSSVRYAMQIMGTQFVMGKNIVAALKRAQKQEAKGYRYSYDMLGEGARTQEAADRYFNSYMAAIEAIGLAAKKRGPQASPGISVKLSAIHPRYELTHRQRVMDELVPRLKKLALAAKAFDIGFTVDAEEADRLELSLEVIEAVFNDSELEGWEGFGLAIQAYQKRALAVVDWAHNLARSTERKMMVRLVKGAYWDSEIKWTQEQGLSDYPVFTRKPATDVSYHACARQLLDYREWLFPQFATHNAYTVATILTLDNGEAFPAREGYEFQRLHGMGESLYDQVLANEGVSCRIYAPVGEHADLLAYLVRRLLENGANSSFVNNIIDDNIPIESLLRDPVDQVLGWGTQASNPNIPLPKDLYVSSRLEYGERKNSRGLELTDSRMLRELKPEMDHAWESFSSSPGIHSTRILNPSRSDESVGSVQFLPAEALKLALGEADRAFPLWSKKTVHERAQHLRKLSDLLEENTPLLLALCCKEAGKTLADGVAEIREAVDFCRYYADRGEELLRDSSLQARGVALCISPWNFPVAIFLGQVSAALVCGNTVLAKPAEQTSLVALEVVRLMHAAGFPRDVVQCIPAKGGVAGETLIPDVRIQAVMFTGSTATAQWLNRALAQRPDSAIPLIAETGGQNAMIVDSTALPEQVVDDVIQSGFQSAGQRCSALRVLFLQDDVADKMIDMITGAMDELSIGDPAYLHTDIGPVIDERAKARLMQHAEELQTNPSAKLLHRLSIDTDLEGHYVAPYLFEIDHLSVLKDEVFGPMVHVIRFKADELDAVIDQINATGFGLTLGVHSRIQSVTARVADRSCVGNVYINRNMIGAIVGVQPFGGCGLSGTGPKAGGPSYLTRLLKASHGESNEEWNENSIVSSQVLPGPTGESNRLIYEPKGLFMAIDFSESDSVPSVLASQVKTALELGNRVILFASGNTQKLKQQFSTVAEADGVRLTIKPLEEWSQHILRPELSGVLVEEDSPQMKIVEQTLSDRQGKLVPVIIETSPRLLGPRLVWEKTVTEDTTAAGGNASLMTSG